MNISEVSKAAAAFVTSGLSFAALFGFNPDIATPENIAAASGFVAAITGIVYQIRNRPPRQ